MSENSKQFDTASSFSLYIESVAREKKMQYMDAVLQYCEENFIDPQDIASMINKSLRDKIAVEMREANLLPKQATLDV
jgi:Phage late-transcription coactivator